MVDGGNGMHGGLVDDGNGMHDGLGPIQCLD